MRADDFLHLLAEIVFSTVFVIVTAQAVRRPRRAPIDIALLFGALAAIVVLTEVSSRVAALPQRAYEVAAVGLLASVAYLLVRLVADFARVPWPVRRGAEAGLALLVLGLIFVPVFVGVAALVLVAYMVATLSYVAVAFGKAATRARGVTRRRLQAVALGTVLFALATLPLWLLAVLPAYHELLSLETNLCSFAAGCAYAVGFAPPTWLRRAWQSPELHAFLTRSADWPHLTDSAALQREAAQAIADTIGAPAASLGLWDPLRELLRFELPGRQESEAGADQGIAGRVFQTQRSILDDRLSGVDPASGQTYAQLGIGVILAAPVTVHGQRLGVLSVYAPKPSVFAESDLELAELLAGQAALLLESRRLIGEAAQLHAREEAARLKDDFLSAAAHDLRTPITSVLGQAQLLQRRARQDQLPEAYHTGLERLVSQGRRLRTLTGELLDASRAERGGLLGRREPVELTGLARRVLARHQDGRHNLRLDADAQLQAMVDPLRFEQLLDNLLENAIKYSPDGGEVLLRLWPEDDAVRVLVRDQGIGIAPEDRPRLFERFHRGRNVDDRRFPGLGLGLYLCQRIVAEHGGRLWAESELGQGSAFHVALPREQAAGNAERAA
jgi:signal transduction histidine kinase